MLYLVEFILLFYCVSQKYINKLNCTVKQIFVCCIDGLKLDVLILHVRVNKEILLLFRTRRWEGNLATCVTDSSDISVCTPRVTLYINCTVRSTAATVAKF